MAIKATKIRTNNVVVTIESDVEVDESDVEVDATEDISPLLQLQC